MEKQISPQTEKRMTRAIEKAAALALVQPEANRSKLLADALLGADVENCFAKTASAAFNRRLTVLRFQKTADEHKADTFPLSNGDEVLALMGGQVDMPKVAAEMSVMEGPFEMTVTKYDDGTIVKTAKAEVTRPLYEETVTYPHFEKHINNVLQANAAAFSREMGKLYKKAAELEREREEVVSMVKNASPFEFKMLCNVFGHDMALHFCDELPEGTDFSKTASVINPHTELFEKVASFIQHENEYIQMHNDMVDYKEGLEEFGKTAVAMTEEIRKQGAFGPTVGMLIRSGTAGTLSALGALDKARQATNEALAQGYNIAGALNSAGTDIGVRPERVLESQFLTADRYRDRMKAWSDLSADPILAKYDPMELFLTAQKAMNTSPALERPDHREELRTYVSLMLPQNGNASAADQAALATTLKSLAAAPGTSAEDASATVKDMNKEEPPEAPKLDKSIFEMVNSPKLTQKDWAAAANSANVKENDEAKKEEKEDAEKKLKTEKELLTISEITQKERVKSDKEKKDKEQKELLAFMKQMGIEPRRSDTGAFEGFYLTNRRQGKHDTTPHFGNSVTPDEIRRMYEAYKTTQGNI